MTGATRGVGRGVAVGLAHAGIRVFATGRHVSTVEHVDGITAIDCDHTDDAAVARVLQPVQDTAGRLDVLVNVAWGGYERMVENGRFTFVSPTGSSRSGDGMR